MQLVIWNGKEYSNYSIHYANGEPYSVRIWSKEEYTAGAKPIATVSINKVTFKELCLYY